MMRQEEAEAGAAEEAPESPSQQAESAEQAGAAAEEDDDDDEWDQLDEEALLAKAKLADEGNEDEEEEEEEMAITGLSSRLAELAEASAKDKAAAEKRKEETLDKLANFSKSKKGGDDDDDDSDDGKQQQHAGTKHSCITQRFSPHSLACPPLTNTDDDDESDDDSDESEDDELIKGKAMARAEREQRMAAAVAARTPDRLRSGIVCIMGHGKQAAAAHDSSTHHSPLATPCPSLRTLQSTPGRRSFWTISVVRMCRMGRRVVSLSRLARHSSRRRRSSIVWVP